MDFKGFLLINKPIGPTSYDVIRKIKRLLPKGTKIGHAGTLDPFASGLLIVAISRAATREMRAFMILDKVYKATGKLGELTDTFDNTGIVIKTSKVVVTQKDIEHALHSLGTSYEQIPPLYSALKVGGKPLYKHARKKSIVPQDFTEILHAKKRMVSLFALELCSFEYPLFTVRAQVSHGTYMRSLINDIAVLCGSVATTIYLCREAIGPFGLSQAIDLGHINDITDIQEAIYTPEHFSAQLINYCP